MSDEMQMRTDPSPTGGAGARPPVHTGLEGGTLTADLRTLPGAELDDLYRAGSSGPIPAGRARGTVLTLSGTPFHGVVAAMVRALAWKGKVFDSSTDELRNLLSPLAVQAVRARVYEGESWFDPGGRAVVLDYQETSRVARKIRDEIRQVGPGVWLGHAYWGRRRVLRFMLESSPAPEG